MVSGLRRRASFLVRVCRPRGLVKRSIDCLTVLASRASGQEERGKGPPCVAASSRSPCGSSSTWARDVCPPNDVTEGGAPGEMELPADLGDLENGHRLAEQSQNPYALLQRVQGRHAPRRSHTAGDRKPQDAKLPQPSGEKSGTR